MLSMSFRRWRRAAAVVMASLATMATIPGVAQPAELSELEARVETLERELAEARLALAAARRDVDDGDVDTAESIAAQAHEMALVHPTATAEPTDGRIRIGPITVGGAVRVNYVRGSYPGGGPGPSRGSDGGNVELDTYRINLELAEGPLIGKLEYRWYDGYNFLHTGWLGYRFEDGSEIQLGLNRVPFGPGPYGVSQSWFFDQHYYVGLADDPDFGVKFLTSRGAWDVDLAWYFNGGGSYRGASEDSARYGYDPVRWRSAVAPDGTVVVGGEANGYREHGQVNGRVIYHLQDARIPTDIGLSLEYGWLDGKAADDGTHWAASVHMVNHAGGFELASQLTRYVYDINADNALGTRDLIPMGAYDFAWPVAARAWLPAVSLSYLVSTPHVPWLDSVRPYVEYSRIVKDEGDFNDSQMVMLGAAWASGGWYVYSDVALSNGNLFVGDDGDNYSNVYAGVGDFGATGNDRWNYRFNINFGYYF